MRGVVPLQEQQLRQTVGSSAKERHRHPAQRVQGRAGHHVHGKIVVLLAE